MSANLRKQGAKSHALRSQHDSTMIECDRQQLTKLSAAIVSMMVTQYQYCDIYYRKTLHDPNADHIDIFCHHPNSD